MICVCMDIYIYIYIYNNHDNNNNNTSTSTSTSTNNKNNYRTYAKAIVYNTCPSVGYIAMLKHMNIINIIIHMLNTISYHACAYIITVIPLLDYTILLYCTIL